MLLHLPIWHNKIIRALFFTALLALLLSLLILYLPVINAEVSYGFTFDFLLTIPLVYLLLIRKTAVPAVTVVPLSMGLVLLASCLIPPDHHLYLDLYKTFALPVLELLVFSVVVWKVRKAGRLISAAGAQNDMYYRIELALKEAFSLPQRFAAIVATEASTFYYAVALFKKSPPSKGFSYHRETGLMAVVGAFMLLIAVETVAVHMLLQLWSVWLANIVSFLSLYSMVFMLAIAGAAKLRPHELQQEGLLLRFGLQETLVPYEQVKSIERLRGDVPEEKELVKMGLMDNYNMIMRVKEPQLINSLYSIKRRYKTLVFWADDPQGFIDACQLQE